MSNQSRDKGNGRYTASKFDQLCVCGHELGVHTAEAFRGKRPCIVGDFEDESCDCVKFRKSRKKAKA